MSNDEYSRGYAAGLRELDHSLSYGAIEKIQAENAALKQEIEKLTGALAGAAHIANLSQIDVRELRQEIEQLKAENERLKEIDERECLIAISIKKERDNWLRKAGENGKFYMDALKEIEQLKIDKAALRSQLDAKLTFIANGMEEEHWALQEQVIQLEKVNAALLECVKWYAGTDDMMRFEYGRRARLCLKQIGGTQ